MKIPRRHTAAGDFLLYICLPVRIIFHPDPYRKRLTVTEIHITELIGQARACTLCAAHLPHGANPVFVVHPGARILIIGQAPGRRVHESSVPWSDASGKRLRQWLGVDDAAFYNPEFFALLPMGFCYPGAGQTGDLPPRPECAPKWHQLFLERMPEIQLTLLFGQYAQERYLAGKKRKTLTETVEHWNEYAPHYLPLPHPSPRNLIWEKKNPWFAIEVLPYLKMRVQEALPNH